MKLKEFGRGGGVRLKFYYVDPPMIYIIYENLECAIGYATLLYQVVNTIKWALVYASLLFSEFSKSNKFIDSAS